MFHHQGVDKSLAAKMCHLDTSNNNRVTLTASSVTSLTVSTPGLVTQIGAAAVAKMAIALGAGRSHPSDVLDLAAGVELKVRIYFFSRILGSLKMKTILSCCKK